MLRTYAVLRLVHPDGDLLFDFRVVGRSICSICDHGSARLQRRRRVPACLCHGSLLARRKVYRNKQVMSPSPVTESPTFIVPSLPYVSSYSSLSIEIVLGSLYASISHPSMQTYIHRSPVPLSVYLHCTGTLDGHPAFLRHTCHIRRQALVLADSHHCCWQWSMRRGGNHRHRIFSRMSRRTVSPPSLPVIFRRIRKSTEFYTVVFRKGLGV